MSLEGLCDVSYSLLFDEAKTADTHHRIVGQPDRAVAVDQLHRSLGMLDEPDSGGDADVIVLAEYTPAQLAERLGV